MITLVVYPEICIRVNRKRQKKLNRNYSLNALTKEITCCIPIQVSGIQGKIISIMKLSSKKTMRAVVLLSGGLDSTLAVKMILDQGIEVEALNFRSVFCTCTPKTSSCSVAVTATQQLGVGLKVINKTSDFLEVVKNPKHGYGRNMNPCIDCRIFIFRKAGEYMREIGASFIATGDVLGERPMSQRLAAMKLIEKESGLEGLVLRPLSARLLKPTIPEQKGWVDREKFLSIQGRSRKPQIQLAKSFGINDYPCPAGGCRLTEPGFAARMRDLIKHTPDLTLNDVQLLKVGRHFRLSPEVKAVVGRDENENEQLLGLQREGDLMLEVQGFPGPMTIVRGVVNDDLLLLSAGIAAGYSKGHKEATLDVSVRNGRKDKMLCVKPVKTDITTGMMIQN
ncbi:7-cyano-7-deazaguanine synthase [Verrucomicrobiota bacterium]